MAKRIVNRFDELLKVRERRENRRIYMSEIANKTDLAVNTVRDYLRNEVRRPDLITVAKICVWLGIHPSEFFTWVESESQEDDDSKELNALVPLSA